MPNFSLLALSFSLILACTAWSDFADVDGDGRPFDAGDCDDADANVYPGAPDAGDGIDNDCDGLIDEDVDADGDEFYSHESGGDDCDDTDPEVRPGAVEVCNDGVDNDCDGGPGHCLLTGPLVTDDADLFVTSSDKGALAGTALLMGDLTGDGQADLLIYAPGQVGALRILTGPVKGGHHDLDSIPVFASPEAPVQALLLGPSIQEDGGRNLVLGVPEAGEGGELLLFGESRDPSDVQVISGVPGEALGAALAWVEPATQSLLAVAAPGAGEQGAVHLINTTKESQEGPQATLLVRGNNPMRAPSLTGGIDLLGDGSSDLVVGLPHTDEAHGTAWIISDSDVFDGALDLEDVGFAITGPHKGALFGSVSAVVPDADGDGYADLAVSAPSNDAYGDDTGAVYIFLSSSDSDAAPTTAADAWAVLLGEGPGDNAGTSVSGMPGEPGGLLIGGASTDGEAKAWLLTELVQGTRSLTQADVRFVESASMQVGPLVVVGGADLNADGLSDLVLGAPTYGAGGGVFVHFGLGL